MTNVKNNSKTNTVTKLKRIDKYYWLNKGYEMVDGGLKRSHEQIKSIKKYINGLLVAYSVATVIDAIYMEIDSFWKLLIIMSPIIIVKWALYYGEISVLPEAKSFYPDSADSSEITYYQYLEKSQKHIKKLKNFALISTITLVLALVLVTWWTVQSKTDENNYSMYTVTNNGKLYLEATLPKNKLATIKLINKDLSILYQKKRLVDNSGKLYFDYIIDSLPSLKDSLYIQLGYVINEKETRQIKKLVLLKQKKNK